MPLMILLFVAWTSLHSAQASTENIFSDDYRYNIGIAAGTIATTYLISEMKDGPAIFAGVYAGATLYLLHERSADFEEVSDFVLPAGIMTLAVVNAALLSDDEYSHNDVFVWNLAGLSALAAYAYWEHNYRNSLESLFSHFVAVSDGHTSRLLFHKKF